MILEEEGVEVGVEGEVDEEDEETILMMS